MRLVILQSNYIPWKGYFDLLKAADRFVVYDSVQYTKNDWRNRNQIATANGPTWLTIPVATSGRTGQAINEAQVPDGRWAAKHLRSIEQALGRRPHGPEYLDEWRQAYAKASDLRSLHEINLLFLELLAGQLDIDTPVEVDDAYRPLTGTPTERLVELCGAVGADRYLTGPAGLDYIDRQAFVDANITLEVIDYRYPEYQQIGSDFTHHVSVLDLLANVGAAAGGHLTGRVTAVDPSAGR